jgi:hypothetical protein
MPEKSRLTWRIAGLRLDSKRGTWLATGFKEHRVSVILLPHRDDAASDEAWLAVLEAAFEAGARDPAAENYLELLWASEEGSHGAVNDE